jgi:hypothetical protein
MWPEGDAYNETPRPMAVLVGAAAVARLAAHSQPSRRTRRIGVMTPLAEEDPEAKVWLYAFASAFQPLGWQIGNSLETTYRWATGDVGRPCLN